NTMMTVREVPNPSDFGVLEVKGNSVLRIVEKPKVPPSNLANVGVYKFFPDIFNAIDHTQLSARNEYEITDSLQMLINSGKKVTYNKVSWWLDVGKPWDLLNANELLMKDMKSGVKGTIEQYATLKGAVQIGEGTVVMSGAYIEGPVIIGKNCKIGPNCYIRPSTYIGDKCHVGAGTEIKNSIIMNGSNAPHINYVGDSVVGERCNLGAGTKIANLRHDGHTVYSTLKDTVVDTGRRKLGAIIGDDVKTGINVSINVGTVIGGGTTVAYGRSVNGYVPPGAKVI
ncbi:MAG: sugar phosphate nucleotidyltransferase, partial [Candidatus Thermoplasmatota archaeon]|nr:sugar phosphate nucleotidyltransferase [Candidatus Thermoplasmatota archaeon]